MTGLIAHEWVEPIGGAERVLDAVVAALPGADVHCLWNDAPDRYPGRRVLESPLARTPLRGRKAAALPLMPAVWRRIGDRTTTYDWMFVSSHLFAHHAQARGVAPERKFVYAHTPARYLWNPELDDRGASMAVRSVAPLFRAVDVRAARRLRQVAANSTFVRDRIRVAWGLDARVIHPPVDVARLGAVSDWADRLDERERQVFESLPDVFVLGASRFVPYKRLDAVIAGGAAAGMPVVIAGSGPEERRLRAVAEAVGGTTSFVIAPSDAFLAALMQRASVFVFPPVEDFGIMPVEAMALGTPVVVNATGGASESVLHGVTGVAIDALDSSSIAAGIRAALDGSPSACRARADDFSTSRFVREIQQWTGLDVTAPLDPLPLAVATAG